MAQTSWDFVLDMVSSSRWGLIIAPGTEANEIQYNLNGSNTDGSFTVDDSNSFFSPYKIHPVAQENKYIGIFSYFIMELYVVLGVVIRITRRGDSNEYTQHTVSR